MISDADVTLGKEIGIGEFGGQSSVRLLILSQTGSYLLTNLFQFPFKSRLQGNVSKYGGRSEENQGPSHCGRVHERGRGHGVS